MYDDAEDEFFQQGYPSQAKPARPVLAAVIASALTTIVVFFILRALENAGAISTPGSGRSASAYAQRSAGGGAAAPSVTPAQVPSVVGMPVEQAREVLKGRNLYVAIKEERSEPGRAAGTVLAQNPLAGSDVQPGTTIEVVSARASVGQVVPQVAGQKIEDATALLAGQGFRLGPQKPAAPGTAPVGLVAGTDPPAGSALGPGASVSLLVATPSSGQAVPKVVGSRLNRAKRTLEEAGFKLGHTRYKYDPCCGEYIILEQDPGPEQPAAPGATVDLVVNEPG